MLLYSIELHALRAAKYKMTASCAVVPSQISLIIRETTEYWRKLKDRLWDTPYSDSNIRLSSWMHGFSSAQTSAAACSSSSHCYPLPFNITKVCLNHSHFLFAELCNHLCWWKDHMRQTVVALGMLGKVSLS